MCSLVSREEKDPLIGTARDVPQFLFIELEKPWASSALQTDHFPDEVFEAYQEGLEKRVFDGKFLPIAPDPSYSEDGMIRLLDYRRPDGPFAMYGFHSYHVPEEELGRVARVLLADPSHREDIASYREDHPPEREVLVCTHMERDPCCGHFGPPIHQALRTHYADEDLRVWQVSHVGGHRYCPNVIDLPEGRYWGRVGLDRLENVVRRTGSFRDVSDQYRGWAALSSPEQIVEKAVFEREGWEWARYRKSSDVSVEKGDNGTSTYRVRLAYRSDERSGTYRGVVEDAGAGRALQSECGAEGVDPEYKQVPQYRLVDLTANEDTSSRQ